MGRKIYQINPTIAKRARSAQMFLHTFFFYSSGPVVQILTPNSKTVTVTFHKTIVQEKNKQKQNLKKMTKTNRNNLPDSENNDWLRGTAFT